MKKMMVLMVLVSFSSFGQIRAGLGSFQMRSLMNSRNTHIASSQKKIKTTRNNRSKVSRIKRRKFDRKVFNEFGMNYFKPF